MWNGEYHFFDYGIPGYNGQDYDGIMRIVYMLFCIITIPILIIIFRKAKHQNITRFLQITGIVMAVLEVFKMLWETIARGNAASDVWPLYTCSLLIYCTVLAGFTTGKIKEIAMSCLTTVVFLGGVVNVFMIAGLRHFPFFTFGAMHSMFFHYMCAFVGPYLVFSKYKEIKLKDILYSMIPVLIMAIIVIPYNYIKDTDYMQITDAGGVPLIEDLAVTFANNHVKFLTPIIMLLAYLLVSSIFVSIYMGIFKLESLIVKKKKDSIQVEA